MDMEILKGQDGKPSLTAHIMSMGTVICLLKLLLSGVTLGPLVFAPFSGGDFAAAFGALAAFYWAKRNVEIKK